MGKNKLTDDIRQAVKKMLTSRPKQGVATRHRLHDSSRPTSAGLWAKPFESDSLGVDPKQITEAREALRASGVNIDFNPRTGAAIITSAKQYRDVAKAVGLYTGRDGYGVPDEDGRMQPTGREPVRRREDFKRKIESEEWD